MTEHPGSTIDDKTLKIIEDLARKIGPKFSFPGWSADDLISECRIFAIQALRQYDAAKGPLENYLARSMRNRALNLKRDHFKRSSPNCRPCADAEQRGQPSPHTADGRYCRIHERWKDTNARKIALAGARGNKKDFLERLTTDDGIEELEIAEIVQLVARKLNPRLFQTWQAMRTGAKAIDNKRKRKVEEAVLGILAEAGLELTLP